MKKKTFLFLVAAIVLLMAGFVVGYFTAKFEIFPKTFFVTVFNEPIKDQAELDKIVLRINQEGIKTSINKDGLIQVTDEVTARRIREILIREDLIPTGTDPWAIFNVHRWTTTDFEQNINFQRAIKEMITNHIKAIDDVDDANVIITFPKDELFASEQNPVTASVIITPKPGSDITENRKKIEGIQKILKFTVVGLKDEYIVITDRNGMLLNDFAYITELDSVADLKYKIKLEAEYCDKVLNVLKQIFSPERVRDVNIMIDMDMSKKAVDTKEFSPITIKPRTPGLAYDDSELFGKIPEIRYEKYLLPYNLEGQTPPAYKDMSDLFDRMTQETDVHNNERSPKINRVTISVNIDGTWKWKYDEKGEPVVLPDNTIEREYTPVPPEQLRAAALLVQNAIGYNSARGDLVTMQNIPFDRTKEFTKEDTAYFKKKRIQQIQMTAIIIFSCLTLLQVFFILFRVIAHEMERRRQV